MEPVRIGMDKGNQMFEKKKEKKIVRKLGFTTLYKLSKSPGIEM